MKKFVSIIITLALLLSIVQISLADVPAPGGPFTTWFQVQNTATEQAACIVAYYNSAGTAVYTSSGSTIPGEDALYVYVPDSGIGTGQYTGVVSCDQPVAASVQFGDSDSNAAYTGVSDPSPTWYGAGIFDNYYTYTSDVVVQNISSGSVDITLDIYQSGNTTPVWSNTQSSVPQFGFVNWDQAGNASLANNVAYAAKISATGDIAPIINAYGSGGTVMQMSSENAFPEGDTYWYVPVILNNYYGWNTSLQVMNVGTDTANFTIHYSNGYNVPGSLAINSSMLYYTPAEPGIPAGNFVYGAIVESTNAQNVVAIVNASNNYQRAASYPALVGGAPKVYVPTVVRRYNYYTASINCQNVGSASTEFVIEYSNGGTSTSPTKAVGASHTFYMLGEPVPDGFLGSATVHSSNGQNIACTVGLNQDEAPQSTTNLDALMSYNAQVP